MKRILLITFMLVSALVTVSWAQTRSVTGTVTSAEDGSTLPGVNVILQGTTTGTVTDIDGNYRLNVPEDGGTLTFTFIGLATQQVQIGARSVVDVVMQSDVEQLGEVVVVGYGTQSDRNSVQSVAQIDNSTFENAPILSAQEAIQGQAAGVQMTSASGIAGSQQSIRIRGVASITGGGSPLFVVDGVPMNDGSSGDYSNELGAVALNPLSEINPSEIASISVLKDASAVAIYGSRGANGVILITTKKGQAGTTRVNVDYYQGVQNPTTERKYMKADEYRQLAVDVYGGALSDYPEGNFDWPEAIIDGGSLSNLNVSASGGSEKTQFFLSGTYYTQDAYAIGNEYERINTRLNLSHQFSNRVRLGANIGIAKTDNDRIDSDNSTYAPLTSAYLQTPWTEPYDEDGNYTILGFIPNILAIENLSNNSLISRRTTGNMFVELDILENLTFKTDFGIDQVQTEEKQRYPDQVSPGGYAYKRIVQDLKWLTTNTLQYDTNIGDDHYLGVLLGQSFEQADYSTISVEGSGFVSDQLPNVGSAATPTLTGETGTGWRLNSLFSRLNYMFKNKYLLEASVRRDGSSRFGADNKYGTFWAVGAGWVLSDESFLQDVEFLSFLKLSGSYGTSGNDRIDNFSSLGLYGAGVDGDYAGNPGLIPSQPANPLLSWEETKQLDITLNTAFFKNRIELEASYYTKTTDGLLLDVPIPYTTGFSVLTQNAGEMKNNGIDLNLKTVNISKNDFEWTTDFNIGFLENEVTSLPEGSSVDLQGRRFVAGSGDQRALEGHSANTFYMIRYNGVNAQTGDSEWLTADGEITIDPTADDRVIVGSAIPDFTGGFRNTFRYKGFDLSAFFTFVKGNKILFGEFDGFMYSPLYVGSFNLDPRMKNYWTTPGQNADVPSLESPTIEYFDQASTLQLRDGDFIRLRNITLGYTFPTSLLERTGIFRSARIYVQGQNLLTFDNLEDGLEPEISGYGGDNQIQGESFFTPPQAKTISAGVSLGF